MSKPMKGVIPAKTAQKPVVEKKETVEGNNAQTWNPTILEENLVDKLMAVFVTRDEIKTVVEKTLQEMVASGAKVSDK